MTSAWAYRPAPPCGLDLSTVSGSTDSDLAMTGAAPEGGAALTLRVHTASGDISVRRVAA